MKNCEMVDDRKRNIQISSYPFFARNRNFFSFKFFEAMLKSLYIFYVEFAQSAIKGKFSMMKMYKN